MRVVAVVYLCDYLVKRIIMRLLLYVTCGVLGFLGIFGLAALYVFY